MISAEPHPELVGLPAGISACLFDLDGVLTDTAALHEAAWRQAFDRVIAAWEESGHAEQPCFTRQDYLDYVDGRSRIDGVRAFLKARGIDLPDGDPAAGADTGTVEGIATLKNDLLLDRIRRCGVVVFPGSLRYLRAVQDAGLRRAVVSSSENTAAVLDACHLTPLVEVRVDGVVIRENKLPGKPDPAAFRFAADELGAPVESCAVFEDAVAGVEAGHDGGFGAVVGVDRVGNGHAEALREAGATEVVDDLAALLP